MPIKVTRLLRSRRLAVGLIIAIVAYSILATLVPQGEAAEATVRHWAVAHPVAEAVAGFFGFHHAYSAPVFLVLAVLLTATTGACAWERTRRAYRIARSSNRLSEVQIERITARPEASYRVAVATRRDDALTSAAGGLERAGLRVSRCADSAHAVAGIWSVWGSPAFHWMLVALMLVVGAGRATRSEGFIALPIGETIADVHESYLQVDEGLLFGEHHSGVEFKAIEIDRDYETGGVEYGPTPLVAAYRDGVEVARTWVRPNSPLRTGPLMVHMSELAPAVTLAVEVVGGGEVGRTTFTLNRSDETSSGTEPQEFTFSGGAGTQPIKARIQVQVYETPASPGGEQVSRAIVETATVDSAAFGPPKVVAEGEFLDMPGGLRLRVAEVKDWVRVFVANDWSVPFIYGLLMAAILALGVAVLVPARRATVLLVENDGVWSLHVATWHSRRDPTFAMQVAKIVRDAAGAEEEV